MKRSIHIFFALFLLIAVSASAQNVSTSGNEDHNAYPLIIALVVLAIAIVTRVITLHQSKKQGNAI